MRRVWWVVVVGTAALALGAIGTHPATAAEGASITAVGWWTNIPVASAPEGGIAVGHGASGPSTVAALNIAVPGEVPLQATLRLTEADAVGADSAVIHVCPTPNNWEPEEGGSMEDAPKAECLEQGSSPLERGDDGTWTADVASLLDEDTVSLMVVPAEPQTDEEPPQGPFHVSFDPPVLDAPAPPSSDAATTTTTEPSSGGASSFTPPPRTQAPVPTTAAPTAEPPASVEPEQRQEQEQAATAPAGRFPTQNGASGGDGRPWEQALFFVVVAAVAGTLAGVGRWQLRMRSASS